MIWKVAILSKRVAIHFYEIFIHFHNFSFKNVSFTWYTYDKYFLCKQDSA